MATETDNDISGHLPFILKTYFWGFCAFILDRTAEELDINVGERGNDMQQRAAGWNRTCGHCSEDTASVHGAPAYQLSSQGAPSLGTFDIKYIKN